MKAKTKTQYPLYAPVHGTWLGVSGVSLGPVDHNDLDPENKPTAYCLDCATEIYGHAAVELIIDPPTGRSVGDLHWPMDKENHVLHPILAQDEWLNGCFCAGCLAELLVQVLTYVPDYDLYSLWEV